MVRPPSSADWRVWLHATWLCEARPWPGGLHQCIACHRCSGRLSAWLGDHYCRNNRRIPHLARGVCSRAAIPMVVVLLVAIFTVHLPNGFSSIKLQFFDAAGLILGSRGTRRTFSISRHLSRYA